MPKKSKKRPEWLNRSLHELDQISQAWDDCLTLEKPRFAERYSKGRLEILVRFKCLMDGSRNPNDFFAIFNHTPELGREQCKEVRGKASSPNWDADLCKVHASDQDSSMFVSVVECLDGPQRLIPSAVRLCPANQAYQFTRGAIYLGRYFYDLSNLRIKPVTQAPGTVNNGEPEVSTVTFLGRPDGRIYDMIQRRSEIVDGVSDYQRNSGRDGRTNLESRNPIAGIGLFISDESIGVSFHEAFNRRFKVVDVLFGPFDLLVD